MSHSNITCPNPLVLGDKTFLPKIVQLVEQRSTVTFLNNHLPVEKNPIYNEEKTATEGPEYHRTGSFVPVCNHLVMPEHPAPDTLVLF